MKPLRSADLRDQIAITRPLKTDNGKGGYVTTWTPVAEPWAQVTGLAGRESVMDQVLAGVSAYQVRIWHRDDLDAGMQIRFGGKDLNIRSIADPFGNRRELLIIADTASTRAA